MCRAGASACSRAEVEGPTVDKGDRWDPAELTDILPDLVAQARPNTNLRGG